MQDNIKAQVVERLKEAQNVLVTVSTDPSVDQLAAAVGLTLMMNKLDKHATAVFSGKVPSTIEFLKPEETLEQNTDSLRDFIISLDKSKADKLRYKVEEDVVRIFITPYRTSLGEDDFEFSQGDFNVDIVVALGVDQREHIDQAIMAHGRILHDATVIGVMVGEVATEVGSINWFDQSASSLCEMVAGLGDAFKPGVIDSQMATAFLTGIVAETERFSNEKTNPKVMTMSAQLMAAGANQQLIATELKAKETEQLSEVYSEPAIKESVLESARAVPEPVASSRLEAIPEAPKKDSSEGVIKLREQPSIIDNSTDTEQSLATKSENDQIIIDDQGTIKSAHELVDTNNEVSQANFSVDSGNKSNMASGNFDENRQEIGQYIETPPKDYGNGVDDNNNTGASVDPFVDIPSSGPFPPNEPTVTNDQTVTQRSVDTENKSDIGGDYNPLLDTSGTALQNNSDEFEKNENNMPTAVDDQEAELARKNVEKAIDQAADGDKDQASKYAHPSRQYLVEEAPPAVPPPLIPPFPIPDEENQQ